MSYFPTKRTVTVAHVDQGSCGVVCRLRKGEKKSIKYIGDGKKKVLLVLDTMESWTHDADSLIELCSEIGIDVQRDCWMTGAVICPTPSNRHPNSTEISACRKHLWACVAELKPKVVVLVGGTSIHSALGNRGLSPKELMASRWTGWKIPDHELHAWVCPILHPSTLDDEAQGVSVARTVYRQTLHRAFEQRHIPMPDFVDYTKLVRILTTPAEILHELDMVLAIKPKYMAYDYETTGLKPYRKGHDIVTCSLAYKHKGKYVAIAFPFFPDIRKKFCEILRSEDIGKIASNMKFEHVWSRVILKTTVRKWVWDTMQAAHVLDNRIGITGLKFQTAVRLGHFGYGKAIGAYLLSRKSESSIYGANAFNNIGKAPQRALLLYNGLDSLFELIAAMLQRREMRDATSLT